MPSQSPALCSSRSSPSRISSLKMSSTHPLSFSMRVPAFCTPFTNRLPTSSISKSISPRRPSYASVEPVNPPPIEKRETDITSPEFSSPSLPSPLLTTTQAILDDMSERPQYYLNVSGALIALILVVVILSATVFALDQLPLIPDVLRIVGLSYLLWFLGKFLLNGGERRRLQQEIEEFVSIARGESIRTERSDADVLM